MIKIEQYTGGSVFIKPESIDFIQQNTVESFKHLTIISINRFQILVDGDAKDVFAKIFGEVK